MEAFSPAEVSSSQMILVCVKWSENPSSSIEEAEEAESGLRRWIVFGSQYYEEYRFEFDNLRLRKVLLGQITAPCEVLCNFSLSFKHVL